VATIIQEAPHHAAAAQAEAALHVQVVIYKLTDKGRQEYKVLKIILEKQLIQAIDIFKKIYDEVFTREEKKEEERSIRS